MRFAIFPIKRTKEP